jgi:hypothetical protein
MSAKKEAHQKWLMCSKFWSYYNKMKQEDTDESNKIQLNQCFANHNEKDEIYPLTVKEIVEAQKADNTLKQFFKSNAVLDNGLELLHIENESCICHKGRLVIPKPLQSHAVMCYHHYLQHPGKSRLKETMKSAIYWKGMRNTIRSKTKSCKTCQVNKKRTQKYGHLPPKIVISTPWEALFVDLVGPHTLKGKDGSSIDFMALTMIDPASSWFQVVELPTIT